MPPKRTADTSQKDTSANSAPPTVPETTAPDSDIAPKPVPSPAAPVPDQPACPVTLRSADPTPPHGGVVLATSSYGRPPSPPPGGLVRLPATNIQPPIQLHHTAALPTARAPGPAPSGSGSSAAPPAPPPPHATGSARLAEKLDNTRIVEAAKQFYLGNGDNMRLSTAWIRDGRANVLVSKADADALQDALAAHAAEPAANPAPPSPARVACSIIGTISLEQNYLRADGNFKGHNPALSWHKNFSKTSLAFALGCPPPQYPNLVSDWHTGLATFESLLPKNVNLKSGHYAQGLPTKHFRLRHLVFERRPLDEGTGGTAATDNEAHMPAQFTITNWPTYSPEAAEALAEITATHIAKPLPAYDLNGDLIPPSQYTAALRGATVLVSFTVTHYAISEKRMNGTETTKHQICLDVDYMRVLVAPVQTSGTKRAAVHLTDPNSNAAKKMRAY